MKKVVKSHGCPFSHDVSSCHNILPTNIIWDHIGSSDSDVSVYFDYNHAGGFDNDQDRTKFLWICESKAITGKVLENIEGNADQFFDCYDAIFTHDRDLIDRDNRFSYLPNAANKHWIVDTGIHPKERLVSMINSGKTMCGGHLIRNKIATQLKDKIDMFGRTFNPIEKKEEGLNRYMFSLAVENAQYKTYVTEKLMDCFATGTLPIYMGSPDIFDHFNPDGIIKMENGFKVDDITKDLYHSKMDAIKDNYERCMQSRSADDLLYDEIVKYG